LLSSLLAAPLRILPSFPTRRSSDLYRVQDASGLVSNVATVFISVAAVNDPPSFTRGANQIVAEDSGPQAVPGWATAISAGPGESDRKSTRLNSSHLVISYAVFCLKK